MEHLNKLCALAHLQELLDILRTEPKTSEDDEAVVLDELMRECADLALVTDRKKTGQCDFGIEQLGYGLRRLAGRIATARQEYLVGDDEIPAWQARLERDRGIESCLEMAGTVADCFAQARAKEAGVGYDALLDERAAKFRSIDLNYRVKPDICRAYGDTCPYRLKHEGCPYAEKDGDGSLVCSRLS